MGGQQGAGPDRAIRVTLPEAEAEIVGAILMDRLGPFAQESIAGSPDGAGGSRVVLSFFPEVAGLQPATAEEVRAAACRWRRPVPLGRPLKCPRLPATGKRVGKSTSIR